MNVTDLPRELFLRCFTTHQWKDEHEHSLNRRRLDRLETYRLTFCHTVLAFLSFRDWTELDKALVNRKIRREYLDIIAGISIYHPLRNETKSFPLFLEWAVSRRLKLIGVLISPLGLDQLRNYADVLLSDVQEILVATPPKDMFLITMSLITKISARNTSLVFDGNDRITVPALKKVMKASPQLSSLSVRGCRFINTQILHHIPVHAPQLTALYMSKCRLLADDILSAVRHLPQLIILDVSSCVSYQTAASILEIRPTLQEFYVNNLLGSFQLSRPDVVRTQLHTFSRSLQLFGHTLRVLSIQESSLLTDEMLVPWIRGNPHLEMLRVATCRKITDTTLEVLAAHCPRLLALDIRDCGLITDAGVALIGLQCLQIRDVALDGCFQVTNAAIDSFYRPNPSERVTISFKQCFRIIHSLIDTKLVSITEV